MRKKSGENKPSNSELLIMKLVWEAQGAITIPYLDEQLRVQYDKEYARTTITTFLKRLEKKEYVHIERKGKYLYITPLKSEKIFKEELAEEICRFWFDGDMCEMLRFMLANGLITKKDKEEILKLLDEISEKQQ